MPELKPEQWAAVRALCEGAPLTYARLSTAMNVHMATISKRARREGWNKVDYRRGSVRDAQRDLCRISEEDPQAPVLAIDSVDGIQSPGERLARLTDIITQQIEYALISARDHGGVLSRTEADNMLTTLKLADRLRETLAEQGGAEQVEEDEDDIEFADLLADINTRILELAEAEAERQRATSQTGQTPA